MTTWAEMSRESFRVAQTALRDACHRSSVSRSYFAAYAAVAQVLSDRGLAFSDQREGPSHQGLREMIQQNIGKFRAHQKRRMKAAMNLLYENRLDADYRPSRIVDAEMARNSLVAASVISGILGVRA